MKFLRTASTRRLLALIGGLSWPSPPARRSPSPPPAPARSRRQAPGQRVHTALAAKPVNGHHRRHQLHQQPDQLRRDSGRDRRPAPAGRRHGRLWLSNDGRLRLELQVDNGDAKLVVNKSSFWVSDPMQNTVYEGTLPADTPARPTRPAPSPRLRARPPDGRRDPVADHQARSASVNLGGVATSDPGDVAGRPAYSVSVSPKHAGGLLGHAQLAWDAVTGVPLRIAIYARGNGTPVLGLTATNISYGPVADSVLNIQPPGRRQGGQGLQRRDARLRGRGRRGRPASKAKHAQVRGVAAVAATCPSPWRRPRRWRACPARASACSTGPASRPRWSPTARTWAASR